MLPPLPLFPLPPGNLTVFENLAIDIMVREKPFTLAPPVSAEAILGTFHATIINITVDTKKRLNNIQGLMAQINSTKDIKAAADLQSRITAEQAIIQNNQTKLDMMSKMFELEEKVAHMQRSQRDACMARHLVDRNYSSCN